MTSVFVYEYCCALGLGREPSDPVHSLYREGRAMRDAVLEDFRRVPSVHVTTLDDVGEPSDEFDEEVSDESAFRRVAAASDFAVLIAPELNGLLLMRANWAYEEGCSLLTPGALGIRRTTDKLWLTGHWENNQVPTPFTTQIDYWPGGRLPAVIKPREGVGSLAIGLVRRPEDTETVVALLHQEYEGRLIAQDFVPGRAASVAFLISPKITTPLLPAYQRLSVDGRFRYEGGDLPIHPELVDRALSLGRRAVECVPGLRGYVGVDLILGEADDGSQDVAIEINPRLTTSYVGLRQLSDFNMAEAMLRVARGELVELRWKPGRVRFYPDGTVYSPATGNS